MGSKHSTKNSTKELNQNELHNLENKIIEPKSNSKFKNNRTYLSCDLKNIKSKFTLKKIFSILNKKKYLNIIKHSKKLQNRLDITIDDFEEFIPIEIEIIPVKIIFGKFINIDEKLEQYYRIYFDNNKKEIKKYDLTEKDKVDKIKIIIDSQVTSLNHLFYQCKSIQKIYFNKFTIKILIVWDICFLVVHL